MKKKILLSIFLGVFALVTVLSLVLHFKNNTIKSSSFEEFVETTEIEGQNGFAFEKSSTKLLEEEELATPKLGVQKAIIDGKVAIRFIATITTLDLDSAVWTRGLYTNDDIVYDEKEALLKSHTVESTVAYQTLITNGGTISAKDVEDDSSNKPYKYFVVYTLKGIPTDLGSYYLAASLTITKGGKTATSKAGKVDVTTPGTSYAQVEFEEIAQVPDIYGIKVGSGDIEWGTSSDLLSKINGSSHREFYLDGIALEENQTIELYKNGVKWTSTSVGDNHSNNISKDGENNFAIKVSSATTDGIYWDIEADSVWVTGAYQYTLGNSGSAYEANAHVYVWAWEYDKDGSWYVGIQNLPTDGNQLYFISNNPNLDAAKVVRFDPSNDGGPGWSGTTGFWNEYRSGYQYNFNDKYAE